MRVSDDLLAGLLFIGFGGLAVIAGTGYGIGTPARMASGFFPVSIGAAIAAIGVVLVVKAGRGREAERPVFFPELRSLVFIIASVLTFALIVNRFGLVPAMLASIVVAWVADRRGRMLELAGLAILLPLLIVGIFVYGLGAPVALFRW